MLEEYYIWNKIFEEKNDVEMYNLIKLVIYNDDAREYVYEKIRELKQNKVKLNINIDKEIEGYPIELLADKIVDRLINEIKKGY